MLEVNPAVKAAFQELLNFPVFHGLKYLDIEKLCKDAEIIVNRHRQQLFCAGDEARYFGIVLSGAYKLSRPSPNGEDTIIYFATSSDVVAALIMSHPNPKYPVSATAMGPSRFLKIPREVYNDVWIRYPAIMVKVQNILSTRMKHLQAQKVLSKSHLSSRLAFLLIEILNKSNTSDFVLPLKVTRKELADNLGASVESVIRIMSDWSKQEIIESKDQEIKILNFVKMLQIAGTIWD